MNNTDATDADAIGRMCHNRDSAIRGIIPIVQPVRGLLLGHALSGHDPGSGMLADFLVVIRPATEVAQFSGWTIRETIRQLLRRHWHP